MASQLKVVFIHGTWGRGFLGKEVIASWCKSDSDFVKRLIDEFGQRLPSMPISVSQFNWSGSNSVFQRAQAAKSLREQLRDSYVSDAVVLIVAHSHGGNVALQAITNTEYCEQTYVCTLATPFIRIFESTRDLSGAVSVLEALAVFTSAMIIKLLASLIGLNSFNPVWIALVVLPIFCLPLTLILAIPLVRLILNPLPEKGPLSPWQLKPRVLADSTNADAGLLHDRLLVLRGIDDEAALTLAAGAIANRVIRYTYTWAVRGELLAFLTMLIFLLILRESAGVSLFYFFWILMLAIAAVFLLLAPLTRLVFGRELTFGAARSEIAFDSVPDSSHAKIITLSAVTESKRLRHAIYEHPNAPACIASWIAAHLEP